MNKTKAAYKTTITNFIVDCYVELAENITNIQKYIPDTDLKQEVSTLKYMKNLIRTITAETDEEIEERIKEGKERFNKLEEEDEDG